MLIFSSLALFLPVSMKSALQELSPVTLMARLASSEAVYMGEIAPGFILLAIAAGGALLMGEKLLEYRENLRV